LLLVALGSCALVGAAACGGGSGEAKATSPERSETTVTTAAGDADVGRTTSSVVPGDPRSQLAARLSHELGGADAANRIVAGMDDGAVLGAERLADGDIASSPWLASRPSTVPAGEVDSLWVFSYGYRLADPSAGAVPIGGSVPPMDELLPGPTNEALAEAAAQFVKAHPVPIVAQWEVARVLLDLGVEGVISVEPDIEADGKVTYLSTAGVAAKGLAAMQAAGENPGHAGVLCFRYHAERCVLTARAAGLTADVPEGADLPSKFDPKSGQDWTRSLETWIPVDLAGRTVLKAG